MFQEVQLVINVFKGLTDTKTLQLFKTLRDKILLLFKVITAATLLSFVTLIARSPVEKWQSNPQGICLCMYLIHYHIAAKSELFFPSVLAFLLSHQIAPLFI